MIKIKRTKEPPESLAIQKLKQSGSYKEKDVIKQLEIDFNNKCYICEMKPVADMQVEHLLPHHNGKNRDRMFDWNNLFLSCSHCNNIKNDKKYEEKIIDCCVVDPEEMMDFIYEGNQICVVAKSEDENIIMTADLCTAVFNNGSTGIREHNSQARAEDLGKEMIALSNAIENLKNNPESIFAKRTLRGLISRKSRYSAFKRYYIRKNFEEVKELLD